MNLRICVSFAWVHLEIRNAPNPWRSTTTILLCIEKHIFTNCTSFICERLNRLRDCRVLVACKIQKQCLVLVGTAYKTKIKIKKHCSCVSCLICRAHLNRYSPRDLVCYEKIPNTILLVRVFCIPSDQHLPKKN